MLNLNVLQAMLACPYKAWQLNKDFQQTVDNTPAWTSNAIQDIIPIAAWYLEHSEANPTQGEAKKLLKHKKRADDLLERAKSILNKDIPPAFYRNSHCPKCLYKESCYAQLKERDCISQIGGMTQPIIDKYHAKGITTITQLAFLFRPRRPHRFSHKSGSYLFELKALAIRDTKTYVLQVPELSTNALSIFIDFEGLINERFYYLLGAVVYSEDGAMIDSFSFWSDTKEGEKANFSALFDLLNRYPDATIYHYGSYESKAIKNIIKEWGSRFKHQYPAIAKRMVNLLGYLRTNVYPPTYGNGLKEVARFLEFEWSDPEADGLRSISWRKQWEATGSDEWKDKLHRYNMDDCEALHKVYLWLRDLNIEAQQDNVEQVSRMKRHSPYKWRSHDEYGEDFLRISKAAYFDYQRSKIYWRNGSNSTGSSVKPKVQKKKRTGLLVWKPTTANEVIKVPPIRKCPYCGNKHLRQLPKIETSMMVTDLKFTPAGIRRHVIKYISGASYCTTCKKTIKNFSRRRQHYGDNFFALIIHYYVTYNLSNYKIGKMLHEHFGIGLPGRYLIKGKNLWWVRNWSEEAQYIRHMVLNAPVIHIDETTVPLGKSFGYVWVFATTHSIFYHFTPTRKADFLDDLLKDYKGVIVTDFYAGYEGLNVTSQKCLIHLIRDLNDNLFKNPFDTEYKAIVTAFNTLLKNIIETIDYHGLQTYWLRKHIKETERYYHNIIEKQYSSELAIKCIKRFKKHWNELWTFLKYEGVPWNNNNAEAGVKAFAFYRRGVKGLVREKRLPEYLEMLTVAQTCRFRNISFLSFLRQQKGLWENAPVEVMTGYLPFKQARLYARRLGFRQKKELRQWDEDEHRPIFIPKHPNYTYAKNGWIDWNDWLGAGFLPFSKARTYIRKFNFKGVRDFIKWTESPDRPKNIPTDPERIYRHTGWNGYGDFLGNGQMRVVNSDFLSFDEAKSYVQSKGLRNKRKFIKWRKSEKQPTRIPSDPCRMYPEFTTWADFLGSKNIATKKRICWDYNLSKAFLLILGVNTRKDFERLYNLGRIPEYIPKYPCIYYKKRGTWISNADFFSQGVSWKKSKYDLTSDL
jgi:predicted RecB family nuclease